MAEVRRPRDRRPAQVDGEAARRTWLQGCHLPRYCVQESEHSKYGSGIMSEKMSTGGAGDKPVVGARPTSPCSRGSRRVGRAMGGRWHLPLRPDGDPRTGLLHRHAPSHRERVAAHGARLFVHAYRHDRPLQADARVHGLVPDGLGRQRPANRKARPELLRGALRPEPALRGRLCPARRGWAAQRRSSLWR